MDFTKSEAHSAVEALAQQVFHGQVDDEYLKNWSDDQAEFDAALWQTIGDAGLIGVAGDEQFGGAGFGFLELSSALEAQGSVLAGVPLWQSAVVANALEQFADAALSKALLPDVYAGRQHLALGLGDLCREQMGSVVSSDGETLSGTIDDVAWAQHATAILIGLHVKGEPALYLLRPELDAIGFQQQDTSYRHAHFQLSVDNIDIDPARIICTGAEVDTVIQAALTALAALQLGVVEEVLKRTAQYTIERQQFGKAIASFQSVSHRAADGYVDCAALRASVLLAAWKLSAGEDARTEARTAKWWACEAGHRIGHTAQHLHGGIGSDIAYPIHRFFRWTKQLEYGLGGAQEQLASLGRLLAEHDELGIIV
ncbi:MAG: acyl-CoA dehydrogenase family protein [Pseudomonadales bacterium]